MATWKGDEMLTKSGNQPAPRAAELAYGERGPGLYPGEVVVVIDGRDVAVSVSSRWHAEGPVSFKAWARVIDPDGSTSLGPEGQELEKDYCFTASATLVERHKVAALSVEMINLMLEEPPTMVDVAVAEGDAPVQAPMIDLFEDVRLSISIRQALAVIGDTSPVPDAAALLGI